MTRFFRHIYHHARGLLNLNISPCRFSISRSDFAIFFLSFFITRVICHARGSYFVKKDARLIKRLIEQYRSLKPSNHTLEEWMLALFCAREDIFEPTDIFDTKEANDFPHIWLISHESRITGSILL